MRGQRKLAIQAALNTTILKQEPLLRKPVLLEAFGRPEGGFITLLRIRSSTKHLKGPRLVFDLVTPQPSKVDTK